MKKKLTSATLAALMLFSLTACGNGGKTFTPLTGGVAVDSGSNDNIQYIGQGIEGAPLNGGTISKSDSFNYVGIQPEYEYDDIDFNTEEYDYYEERGFSQASVSPLSTFAADVDTASYSNIRRIITSELDYTWFDKGAVRIEEMINYFNYDYNTPDKDADVPFEVTTTIYKCPWNTEHYLMQVGLCTPKIDTEDMPRQNIVLLLDISGSMEDSNKLPYVKESMGYLIDNLVEGRDSVQVVTYNNTATVEVSNKDELSFEEIKDRINNITAYGGTAGSDALELAYKLASESYIKDGNNLIILASDGDFNVGMSSVSQVTDYVKKQAKSNNIYISVFGFGMGNYKDNTMESIADNGNGQYFYIDTLPEAKRVIMSQTSGGMVNVAKDVKYQVEFNPNTVDEYRLIGYENRMMAAEDFNDDTKDGGEIGYGQVTTALYEIIPAGLGNNDINLKYQTSTSTNSEEICTVSIRYKEPKGTTSKLVEFPIGLNHFIDGLSDNMKKASAVAEFGMLLRESKFSGNASSDSILGLLNLLGSTDQDIDELIELVKTARDKGMIQ